MKANPNFIHLKRSVPQDRITLLQGGTRSGKTFSIIYYLIWLCNEHQGIEIDICRDTFTALKATVWKDFKEVLVAHGLYSAKNHNKTDHIYFLNGNTINYYGADNPDKIHGRKRDILWLNESNHISEETVDQLFPRTKYRIICDYNPALPQDHWLDRYIDDYPPCITTYKDNPHLTESQILDIESRQDNKYWWSVYGSGERTKPVGVIFDRWSVGEFPNDLPIIYGQDYGFSNDPTTLVKVAVSSSQKKIYCEELLYEKGLSTDEIAKINKAKCGEGAIVGDSAEPRLIEELRRAGCNIYKAEKGQGSVTAGISILMDYEIVITKDSTNLRKELNNYVWADKKSAVPVDKWNHLIDAARYATMRHIGGIGNYVWGGS